MFWYQQKTGGFLEYVGLLHYDRPEMQEKFESRFKTAGHAKGDGFLIISGLAAGDSAVYYCAAKAFTQGFKSSAQWFNSSVMPSENAPGAIHQSHSQFVRHTAQPPTLPYTQINKQKESYVAIGSDLQILFI